MANPPPNLESWYHYSPLTSPSEQIRLCKIPSQELSPSQKIYCELSVHSIEDLPKYYGLSYTWGLPEEHEESEQSPQNQTILIGEALFEVTPNLFHALKELISRIANRNEKDFFIWIDAMCIDQTNTTERNQQVSIMDVIYYEAETVIVWLGEDTRGEAHDVKIIQTKLRGIGRELFHTEGDAVYPDRYKPEKLLECIEKAELPEIGSKEWMKICNFFKVRWFSRIWVVQEVALAKEVQFWQGQELFEEDDISWCSLILGTCKVEIFSGDTYDEMELQQYFSHGFHLSQWNYWCRRLGKLPDFLSADSCILANSSSFLIRFPAVYMLLSTDGCKVLDLRDKVFGILGISKRLTASKESFITADYSCSTERVFIDMTTRILRESNWLGFLSTITDDTMKRSLKLPSWVYDAGQLFHVALGSHRNFNAPGSYISSAEHPAPSLTIQDDILSVHGVRVAQVCARSKSLHELQTLVKGIDDVAKLFLDQPRIYDFTQEPLVDVLWRTLLTNRMIDKGLYDIPAEQWRQTFKYWWIRLLCTGATRGHNKSSDRQAWFASNPHTQKLAEQDDTGIITDHRTAEEVCNDTALLDLVREESMLFRRNAIPFLVKSRLFRTSEGHFGLGTESLEIGDEVWIMPRSFMPFLLRKSPPEASRPRYHFIGEAYVHGIMHGEQFHNGEAPNWEHIELE